MSEGYKGHEKIDCEKCGCKTLTMHLLRHQQSKRCQRLSELFRKDDKKEYDEANKETTTKR